MASEQVLKNVLEKQNMEFEVFFKKFINEEFEMDVLTDVITSAMKKLVNSIRYWSKKMQNAMHKDMIIFTTFSLSASGRVSFLNIFKALNDIFDLTKIKQLYIPENKNFIGIEFSSEEDYLFVKNNFKMVGEAYIVHTCWINEAKIHQGRIHWLPIYFDKYKISEFLSKYFILSELNNYKVLLYDNIYKETNVLEFKGLLKVDCDIEKIPHIVDFDDKKALVTIKGRKPLCTNCKKIGHIRKDCSYIYCPECKMEVVREHDCGMFRDKTSYAEIMKLTYKNKEQENILSNAIINKNVIQSEDEKSDADWLVVKRNNTKSYSKKLATNDSQIGAMRLLDAVDDVKKVGGDLLSATGDQNMDVATFVKTSDGRPQMLKRKLNRSQSQEELKSRNMLIKLESKVEVNSELIDKNPFEVLSTDESETY